MELIVILITFGYGLFFVLWPEKARKQFLSRFDLDGPTKWYRPNTYMKFKPPAIAFRVFGLASIGASVFLLYLWKNLR